MQHELASIDERLRKVSNFLYNVNKDKDLEEIQIDDFKVVYLPNSATCTFLYRVGDFCEPFDIEFDSKTIFIPAYKSKGQSEDFDPRKSSLKLLGHLVANEDNLWELLKTRTYKVHTNGKVLKMHSMPDSSNSIVIGLYSNATTIYNSRRQHEIDRSRV